MPEYPCKFSPVARFNMTAAEAFEVIGPTPAGFRINSFIAHGEVIGATLRGTIRARGCGDWVIVRPDDIADVDVRLTIETHDGALIYMTYGGIGLLGKGGAERMRRGEPAAPVIPVRIAARMTTASPAYAWVNGIQFFGIGATTLGAPTRVEYDVYALE